MSALAQHCLDFPDLSAVTLDEAGLSDRDAAFMHAVYDAAVRRWSTLEWIVSRAGGRESSQLDPVTRAGLLAGSAQLLLLDRVPDHAAIDRSVEWVKQTKGRGASGLVNAVLRKVAASRARADDGFRLFRDRWSNRRDEIPLGDGRALILKGDILPQDNARRAAVATSVSQWLVERWSDRLGLEEAGRIAWHSIGPAPVILNAAHAAGPVEFPVAAGGSLVLRKHDRPGHLCVEGPRAALVGYLESRSDVWVQDPSSSEAVESVSDLSPSLVVDLCAGQGTKTRQLAATFPRSRIVATDVDARRLATLRKVTAGMERVQTVDSCDVEAVARGRADLVLLDVPCSNSGVLARRIEARHRAGPEQLARLTQIQEAILDRAVSLCSPGGFILYSTCSIEEEENQAAVRSAAQRHSLVASRVRRTLPGGGPGAAETAYRDGSFSAVLGRTAVEQAGGVHSASR
ncbi:MAG: ribosomal RNA small subunit methyltransferase B [Phycisphaerae bacterium]